MKQIRLAILLTLVVLKPAFGLAQDQPEAVVSWDVEFWQVGVDPNIGQPVSVMNFSRGSASCGQVKVAAPAGTVSNPTAIRVDDPAGVAHDCVLGPDASGVLIGLPVGSYFATARARGATLLSPRSANSNPFSRAPVVAPPPAPTGLRLTR